MQSPQLSAYRMKVPKLETRVIINSELGSFAGGGCVSKDQRDRDHANEGRDERQGTHGAMRGKSLRVQHTEMLGSLIVLAHRVGHRSEEHTSELQSLRHL